MTNAIEWTVFAASAPPSLLTEAATRLRLSTTCAVSRSDMTAESLNDSEVSSCDSPGAVNSSRLKRGEVGEKENRDFPHFMRQDRDFASLARNHEAIHGHGLPAHIVRAVVSAKLEHDARRFGESESWSA